MNSFNNFPFQIFRAYDIRGKVDLMRPELIQAIGYALSIQYVAQGQKKLSLGYDARLTSPYYAQMISQIFTAQGIQVTEIGCCSTPQLYFAARHTDGNGIMVTASHNPKTDNGIKWVLQSEPPSPEMIQAVGQQAAEYLQTHTFESPSNDQTVIAKH